MQSETSGKRSARHPRSEAGRPRDGQAVTGWRKARVTCKRARPGPSQRSDEEGRLWDRTPGPVSANERVWFNLASAGVPIWKTGAIMTRVTALS